MIPSHRHTVAAIVWTCFLAPISAGEPMQYNRDIRPILAENCFACHGPDSAARKANLRLDLRDQAIESGAITPGQPEESELIARIDLPDDDASLMPPQKSHKRLTIEQKNRLKRWIAEGAVYQPHWSFIPAKRPTLPVVNNTSWVRNPIDTFILAELEKRRLSPAPEADRRVLARRLSLDLTGLPPRPEDVDTFVADQSPDYYEKFVDRLLSSQRWGEHRGRYWLDAARYADTHGIHFDNYREIWIYRDWVINAFNHNMPFDQFTREQLAGDLLPAATLDQLIATGFNRCNITTNEGGVIPEEYLVLYTRDRTETTSQVWLGLTMGCAVCHDHKYDPISQREFYQLAAFFNNTTQGGMDGNIPDTPPVVTVPRIEDRERYNTLSRELATLRGQLSARRNEAKAEFEAWRASANEETLRSLAPDDRPVFFAWLDEGQGQRIRYLSHGRPLAATIQNGELDWQAEPAGGKAFASPANGRVSIPDAGDFDWTDAFSISTWVRVNRRSEIGSLFARMEPQNGHRGWDVWVEGSQLAFHLIHRWDQNAIKVRAKQALPDNDWHHLCISYDGSGQAAGVKMYFDGKPLDLQIQVDRLSQSIRTTAGLTLGQRSDGSGRLPRLGLKELTIYNRVLTPLEVTRLAGSLLYAKAVLAEKSKTDAKQSSNLFDWWLRTFDKKSQSFAERLAEAEAEESRIRSRGTVAHVMVERPTPAEAYVLHRGEYDQRRDKVSPNTPQILPAFPADYPKNRLGLAQWLVRDDNPLTARVIVNRFWQELFGTGLVRTAGDLGLSGELPSHPELLDYLAVYFRESGWDVKKLFKLMVTSATYRQAAITTPEKRERDPDNRYLSRGPRFRMDAEMIRDYALAVSDLLVERVGGPSVKPYQPDGVWEAVAMRESNTRYYKRDTGENLYRRSLYTFWKRSAPPAFLDVMNAPNRETCTVRRERTNTPLQALLTLNDVQYIEAARNLAEIILKSSCDDDKQRFQVLARKVLCRSFTDDELTILDETLQRLLKEYHHSPNEARHLLNVGEKPADTSLNSTVHAAWTMLVNQVLNMDEVLNK